MHRNILRRKDLVYPELSYQIIGTLFDVYNSLGYGYRESYYQKAICKQLCEKGLSFREQVVIPVMYHGKGIGNHRLDFLIENKIILEIKKGVIFRD